MRACLLFLALCMPAWCNATPAVRSIAPACSVTAPAAEPPAWLLLAGAVVLLGAGRLAAS